MKNEKEFIQKILSERMEKLGWNFYDTPFNEALKTDYLTLDNLFNSNELISVDNIGFTLDLMRAVLNEEME